MATYAELNAHDKIIPLNIDFKEDIPDHDVCPFCGEQTDKTLVELEVPFCLNNQVVVARAEVPGYKCPACDLDTLLLLAGIKAYEAALILIKEAKDEQRIKEIEDSIRVLKLP